MDRLERLAQLPLVRGELEKWERAGLSPGYLPTNWLTREMDETLAEMLEELRASLEELRASLENQRERAASGTWSAVQQVFDIDQRTEVV